MQVAPRLYVEAESGGVETYRSDAVIGPKIWSPEVTLVPRSACAFRRLKLADSSSQGYAALRLQALTEARDGHDGVYIRPGQTGRWANVWTFKVPSPLRGRAIPETELQNSGAEGLRLVQTLFGVEGQFWYKGELLASRWWASSPKPHQWASFLQGLDQAALGSSQLPLSESIPRLATVSLSRKIPFLTAEAFRTGPFSPRELLKPSRLLLTIIFGSFLFGAYLGSQSIHAHMTLHTSRVKVEDLSTRTQTIMSDRQAALGNLSAMREFDSLGSQTLLLEAWDQLAEALRAEPVTFRSFNYNNSEIEITIDGVFKSTAADIVTKIEGLPAFSDVTYTLDRESQSTLKAKIFDWPRHNQNAGEGS